MTADPFLLGATVWLSVFAWAGAEILRRAVPRRPALARALWSVGAALLAVHTAVAFHYRHAWSHAAAYEATAQQSAALTGVAAGWGLFLNYAMVVIWAIDAGWWWLDARGHQTRARALDRALFAFFVFMMINGAVIFASSPMRWAGAVAVAAVLAARFATAALPHRGR